MTGTLLLKVLRDLRVALLIVCLLLAAFQCLWTKVTERISGELLPMLVWLGEGRNVGPKEIEDTIFKGPGKIVKSMIGGESMSLFRLSDMLSVGYVHAVMMTILSIWGIGRASSAIVGEIDRGTMELLLAQPVARSRVVAAHFVADLITIPLLCLSLWAGNWIGFHIVGIQDLPSARPADGAPLTPAMFGPALWNVGALVFAISGTTMWLSARGRFRGRVLGAAVLLTLLQYLVNVIGQLWDTVAPLRRFTIFYYYQPQQVMLRHEWMVDVGALGTVHVMAVLLTVGLVGYGLALWTFCRRDLPAPL